MTKLERADFPEQVGVDSDKFTSLLRYFEDNKMDLNSLVAVRDGKVACECYWTPNEADIPHDMYSLSKSITATAVGIALDEGIISLDTKVFQKYFPSKLRSLKGKQREWAEKVTIHDVLAMRLGKVVALLDDKEKTDWIDALLDKKSKFAPGDGWKYVSENDHLLSYIIQKETGLSLTEFLTPRLYEPLGMKVPHWDKSRYGVDAGGWGLKLTAEDLSKIAVLYLNKGVYNGQRIFSEEWYEMATVPYSPPEQVYPSFLRGTEYGYQIWIDHENNDKTIRFTGLFGQHMFMFPDYNAAIIITASDTHEGQFIHTVYEYFPKGFIEKEDKPRANFEQFKAELASKKIECNFKNPVGRNTAVEKRINNRLIKVIPTKNLSTQGISTFFMWSKKIGYLNELKFDFSENSVAFSFKEKACERCTINIGLDGKFIRNELHMSDNDIIVDAQGTWNKDGSLEILLYSTGRPHCERFTFKFHDKYVTVRTKCQPAFAEIARFNMEFTMGMKVGKVIKGALNIGCPIFEDVYADPNTVGVFVD